MKPGTRRSMFALLMALGACARDVNPLDAGTADVIRIDAPVDVATADFATPDTGVPHTNDCGRTGQPCCFTRGGGLGCQPGFTCDTSTGGMGTCRAML